MVWHTFMLNPRRFTEDCIRYNKLRLWKTGLPWEAIDACINNETFEYSASLYDSPDFTIPCPKCKKSVSTRWTTCDSPDLWDKKPGELGIGYADKKFEASCDKCGFITTHEVLCGMKFRHDVELLRSRDYCMAGTILDHNGKEFCLHNLCAPPIDSV